MHASSLTRLGNLCRSNALALKHNTLVMKYILMCGGQCKYQLVADIITSSHSLMTQHASPALSSSIRRVMHSHPIRASRCGPRPKATVTPFVFCSPIVGESI